MCLLPFSVPDEADDGSARRKRQSAEDLRAAGSLHLGPGDREQEADRGERGRQGHDQNVSVPYNCCF